MSEHWRIWAEKSACECTCDIPRRRDEQGCLEPNIEVVHHGAASSYSSDTSQDDLYPNQRHAFDLMGNCDANRNPHVKAEDSKPNGIRRMEQEVPKHSEIDSIPAGFEEDELVLTVSAFVRLINETGFGEVLTERQLLRQRRAFPSIDAGRGRIKVLPYLASLCSRRRRSRNSKKIGVSDLAAMLEIQRYRCALTGEKLTPENLALDHIVPVSEGGKFTVENSQLVTKAVNRAKHTMPQEEFVSMCKRVAQHFGLRD